MRKNVIKAIAALVCVCCVSMGWAQTKEDNFSLHGVELGSLNWGNSKYSNGEIFWNDDDTWPFVGWDLSGVDLSKYSGLRLEVNSGKADVEVKIDDVVGPDEKWHFRPDKKGVIQINFNGVGTSLHEGTLPEPDTTKGLLIYLIRGDVKSKNEKTVIKKVELIEKTGEEKDYSYLNVMGRRFGTKAQNCTVDGNTITWNKGENDFRCGWVLEDVDLSEYSRIKIELEKNELGDFEIELWGKDWENRHTFTKSGPNEYVANLTGEGAVWKDENAVPFDLSQGMNIYLFKDLGNKKLSSEKKTVVKSVTLIKDANTKLKELEFLGASFGSDSWNAYVSDNAEICWEKSKDGGHLAWNLNGVDLTPYKDKKVRIEIESSDVPLCLEYNSETYYASFNMVASNVFEEYLTGKNARWLWGDDVENYDLSKGFSIKLRTSSVSTKGTEKTVVKSISLVDADETPIPDLNLAGVNLGTYRNCKYSNCYVKNNNKIIWVEKAWNDCGWDLTGIDLTETPVVSIELESTDVPVRIRIRQANTDEGNQYWFEFKDTASHAIQIDLSKKEAWDPVKKTKVMPESKSTKSTFDISKGAVIYITPESNPTKPGKTTVVRKVELLKEFTK